MAPGEGIVCSCPLGMELGADNKTCQIQSYCAKHLKCSQKCEQDKYNVKCSCYEGWMLEPDGESCRSLGVCGWAAGAGGVAPAACDAGVPLLLEAAVAELRTVLMGTVGSGGDLHADGVPLAVPTWRELPLTEQGCEWSCSWGWGQEPGTPSTHRCGDRWSHAAPASQCPRSDPALLSPDPFKPFIIFSNRHEIRRIDLHRGDYSVLVPGLRNTIALDFHLNQSSLYWTDVVEDKIYRGKLLENGGV